MRSVLGVMLHLGGNALAKHTPRNFVNPSVRVAELSIVPLLVVISFLLWVPSRLVRYLLFRAYMTRLRWPVRTAVLTTVRLAIRIMLNLLFVVLQVLMSVPMWGKDIGPLTTVVRVMSGWMAMGPHMCLVPGPSQQCYIGLVRLDRILNRCGKLETTLRWCTPSRLDTIVATPLVPFIGINRIPFVRL